MLKCNETNFNSSFGEHELLSSVCFSLRGGQGNEKNRFLFWGRFRSVLAAFTNTKTQFYGEWNKVCQINDEPRLSCKQNIKACLATLSVHAIRPRRQTSGPPYLHSVYRHWQMLFEWKSQFDLSLPSSLLDFFLGIFPCMIFCCCFFLSHPTITFLMVRP